MAVAMLNYSCTNRKKNRSYRRDSGSAEMKFFTSVTAFTPIDFKNNSEMWRCLNIYNLNEKKLDNRKRNAYELVL
jgi:hypothetical protein